VVALHGADVDIAVAYAATRIHQRAKQHWTVPATAGKL
jgi:hypothetical protein